MTSRECDIAEKRGGSRSSVHFPTLLSGAMDPNHCTLLIFGMTLSSVLDTVSDQRDLDVVELWSGVESIVSAAKAAGFNAMPFDKFRIPGVTDTHDPNDTEDILLEAGFRKALSLVLRLRTGGLLWMAPVCSSWIFLNLRRTKRTRVGGPRFQGNVKYVPVQEGNRMAEMAAFLFLVAVCRGVQVVVENPAASMMFNYEIFANACALWSKRYWAVLPHCRYSTAPFGSRYGKKFKLMGSHAWVLQLACKCLCPGHRHKKLISVKTVRGKRAVTGVKQALKDSSAYPPAMGTAVIQKWMSNACPEESQSARPKRGPRSKVQKSKVRGTKRPDVKSKVRGSQRSNVPNVQRSWATLDLDESLATSSSSSRARHCWQALDLHDGADLSDAAASGVGNSRTVGATKKWQTLDFDEDHDLPKAQHRHRWQNLSLDE